MEVTEGIDTLSDDSEMTSRTLTTSFSLSTRKEIKSFSKASEVGA